MKLRVSTTIGDLIKAGIDPFDLQDFVESYAVSHRGNPTQMKSANGAPAVSAKQREVLDAVRKLQKTKKPLIAGELAEAVAEATGRSKGSVSQALSKLANAGHLSRETMDRPGQGKKPIIYRAA